MNIGRRFWVTFRVVASRRGLVGLFGLLPHASLLKCVVHCGGRDVLWCR